MVVKPGKSNNLFFYHVLSPVRPGFSWPIIRCLEDRSALPPQGNETGRRAHALHPPRPHRQDRAAPLRHERQRRHFRRPGAVEDGRAAGRSPPASPRAGWRQWPSQPLPSSSRSRGATWASIDGKVAKVGDLHHHRLDTVVQRRHRARAATLPTAPSRSSPSMKTASRGTSRTRAAGRRMKAVLALALAARGTPRAGMASAHPHIWIQQVVRAVAKDGKYTHVEIEWRFDPSPARSRSR